VSCRDMMQQVEFGLQTAKSVAIKDRAYCYTELVFSSFQSVSETVVNTHWVRSTSAKSFA